MNITIGPFRIAQLIPQDCSGVTEVKFIAPIHSLRIFCVKDGVIFPKTDKTRWCNFSWTSRLPNLQKYFGETGGAMIISVAMPADSRREKIFDFVREFAVKYFRIVPVRDSTQQNKA